MNKRLILLLGIFTIFYVLWIQLGWMLGIIKTVEVETPPEPPPIEEINRENPAPAIGQEETDSQDGTPTEPLPPVVEREFVILENEELLLELDNRGGIITSAILKNYFVSNDQENQIVLVAQGRHYPGEVVFPNGTSTMGQMFSVEKPNAATVVFTWQDPSGTLRKTYRLDQGFELRLETEWSGADKTFKVVVGEGLQPLVEGDKLKPGLLDFGAISPKILHMTYSKEGDHKSKTPDKKWNATQFEPRLEESAPVDWAGVKDTYFANVYVPDVPSQNVYVKKIERMLPGEEDPAIIPAVAIEGNGTLLGHFYMGPILDTELSKADPLLQNLLTYGWAGLLSEWLFHALDYIHGWTGNWGWAIVILTLLIRFILVPLMIPSLKSSYKMREIQPKIQKLKEKFKGDDLETKQKLSQATFKLYKDEGVNPFSSCITAIVQMPIFFAYFSLLRSSIYLRQADWMYWINDLSIKDPTYVLPIIMGVTMYFSTAAMPMPSADPTQAKLMKFMPVIFSLMFLAMPSGLILYMITSNVFTLVQTYVLKWRFYK